jgi:hypothetical protein
MSQRGDPRERWRWEDDQRQREEREMVEREGFSRDAGDPRWGTGGLRVDERVHHHEDRAYRAAHEDASELAWVRGAAPRHTPPRAPPIYEEWESARGPYVGIGPRGYRRTDERIREDVCERFAEHGLLDPSDVEVAVHEAEVLLTGSVATRAQKRLAEDIADHVFGVSEVQNHLRVQRAGERAHLPRGALGANDLPRAHQAGANHR